MLAIAGGIALLIGWSEFTCDGVRCSAAAAGDWNSDGARSTTQERGSHFPGGRINARGRRRRMRTGRIGGSDARLASSLLGVSPLDPLTFAAVALGLIVTAPVTSYISTIRAAQVDPLEQLRLE
jgi:hypothetical protein